MNRLGKKIAAEMAIPGAVSFERFMELALYCPNYGYYEREADNIGARGDFYTSVSVGGLFGAMLGWQFAEWLQSEKPQASSSKPQEKPKPQAHNARGEVGERRERGAEASRVQLVEAGAHNGQLGRDILQWMRAHRPELFERLDYCIVEPSERRRRWQAKMLSEFGGKVKWVRALGELQQGGEASGQAGQEDGVDGIIFSNELLDALPVRRWGWDAAARRWFEWGVSVKEDRFEWTKLEPQLANPESPAAGQLKASRSAPGHVPSALLRDAGDALGEVLPDGFAVETHEAAAAWWSEAAAVLRSGRLVALDYGLMEEELFTPERQQGTLRAYRKHQVSADVLADPGEQDLTAHVNFSRIGAAGEAAGLRTELLTTQERFLTGIAARIWQEPSRFGQWTEATTKQFRTLTHPEHLGRAFKVLVQARQPA